jgi:hypothetical protein
MEDSFFVVPSVASPSKEQLQTENVALKAELQMTKTRLANAEQAIRNCQEHEKQLRDNILMICREVRLSGDCGHPYPPSHLTNNSRLSVGYRAPLWAPGNYQQRPSMRRSRVSFQPSAHGIFPNPTPEADHIFRIREPEEETRLSRIENERNWVLCHPLHTLIHSVE